MVVSGWALRVSLFTHQTVPGWASTVRPIFFPGGVQLLSLGVIGEYLGKIDLETKGRPRFVIDRVVGMAIDENEPCQASH
jgi:polyisoprenyl-phosphate glycosyltransferase